MPLQRVLTERQEKRFSLIFMDSGVVGLEPNGRTVLGTTVHPSIERTGTFGSCTLKTDGPGSGRSWTHARPKVHYKNT